MSHLQIAVLRGGPGDTSLLSMRNGASVLEVLYKKGYRVKDIIVTKQGEWLENGVVKNPEILLRSVDLVFISLLGTYGEDGQVQKILKRHNVKFTGSDSLSSAIAFNKNLTKKTLESFGVLMPKSKPVNVTNIFDLDSIVDEITNSFGPEYIIKPIKGGSSFGISLVREGENLKSRIDEALTTNEEVLVEEFIRGREASCSVLENFRNDSVYIFPSIEVIVDRNHQFYSSDAKTNCNSLEVCPANFTYSERVAMADITALAHSVLHLSQYSKSDYIVNKNGVYFLETNSLPSLHIDALYPKTAAAVGLKFDDLIVHLIETATR